MILIPELAALLNPDQPAAGTLSAADLDRLPGLAGEGDGMSQELAQLPLTRLKVLSKGLRQIDQLELGSCVTGHVQLPLLLARLRREWAVELAHVSLRTSLGIFGFHHVPGWIETVFSLLLGLSLAAQVPGRELSIELVTLPLPGGRVQISLRDNGRGFAGHSGLLDLSQPLDELEPGNWLSLHVIRKLIGHNGGSLEVRTQENRWTRYDLVLTPFPVIDSQVS